MKLIRQSEIAIKIKIEFNQKATSKIALMTAERSHLYRKNIANNPDRRAVERYLKFYLDNS